jgi:4-hydroxymandelate synthase
MEVLGLDHLELYVAALDDPIATNIATLGLEPSGRSRPVDNITSLSYRCGNTSLVLTTPSGKGDAADNVAGFLHEHGSGVANICLRVNDAPGMWQDAVDAGAEPLDPLGRYFMNGELATMGSIRAFGDVALTFIERSNPNPARPFGFINPTPQPVTPRPEFQGVDHLAVCLPPGELEATAAYYIDVLGFVRSFEERVTVGGQAMDSVVVQDPTGALVLTLLCQDPDLKPGQISRFVDANQGAGVQHIAFLTPDVLTAVQHLRDTVDFLEIPPSYYTQLEGDPTEITQLQQVGVLRDRDHWGTILQTFTRSTHPRETLFFELVERRGARTFGSGNIRALYQAVGRIEPVDTSVHPDEPL